MDDQDWLARDVGRYESEEITGHWVSGGQIQQLSGAEAYRVYWVGRVGLSGKRYYSHRYWGLGGNRMWGSDVSQWAMRGKRDRRETAFPAG